MAQYDYTSLAKLRSRISTTGVTLRTDDITVPEGATLVADVIAHASDEVEMYIGNVYSLSQASTHGWVNQKCTDLAIVYLCMRRNNPVPDLVLSEYERALADLEKVRLGILKIPGLANSKGAAPAISNLRVSQKPFNRVVVERARSRTAGAERHDGTRPNYDWTEWFEYGSGVGAVG